MTAGNDASLHNGPGDAAGPGPELTVIVDGANVVGSRPDGWWRDRAGAAVRLHDELAKLAARGAAGIPAEQLATEGDRGPGAPAGGPAGGDRRGDPGAGRSGPGGGAADRRTGPGSGPGRAGIRDAGRPGAGDGGTVQVVSAPGSGDDEIVRLAKSRPGRRIVVTADRELRRRCLAVGAQVAGPSWLYALL